MAQQLDKRLARRDDIGRLFAAGQRRLYVLQTNGPLDRVIDPNNVEATETLAQGFSNEALTAPTGQPFISNADGEFPGVWFAYGVYDFYAPDDATNPITRWQAAAGVNTAELTTLNRIYELRRVNVMDPSFAPSVLHATGAIADGALHPLSDYFATLAAAQAIYPFVTALTQQRDWAACEKARRSLPAPRGGVLEIPAFKFRMGNTGFVYDDRIVHWVGEGTGIQPDTGSQLVFDAGVTGVNPKNGASGFGGRGSMQGIRLTGLNNAPGTNDGLRIQSPHFWWRDVVAEGFGRYGFAVISGIGSADVTINANCCTCLGVFAWMNYGGGMYTEGVDSNQGTFISVTATSNGGWNIYDDSFLGNTYIDPHCAAGAGVWAGAGDFRFGAAGRLCRIIGGYSEAVTPTGSTATTTSASPNLTLVTAPTAHVWTNGMRVTGAGIPDGTTILSGGGTATMVMSQNATASAAGVAISGKRIGCRIEAGGAGNHMLEFRELVNHWEDPAGLSKITEPQGGLHDSQMAVGPVGAVDFKARDGIFNVLRGKILKFFNAANNAAFTVQAKDPDALGRGVLEIGHVGQNCIDVVSYLRLVPSPAPTKAAVGEMYMASAGVLKVCTVAGDTAPTAPTFVSVGTQT